MDGPPILQLAPELREMIYTELGIRSSPPLATSRFQGRICVTKPTPSLASLLRTCKQLHEECSIVLYSANRFNFTDSGTDSYVVKDFINMIGHRNATMMRSITVSMPDLPDMYVYR
jgi:hypothetical protein